MLGREKLEVWDSCELHIKRGFDREYKAGNVYLKSEADSVMDAMDAHIKKLEAKTSADYIEYQRKTQEQAKRIAELEATISKMETTTSKWISVKDRLPNNGALVLVCFDERVKSHYYPIDVVRWDSSYQLQEISVTHWMPLPPPPTTEEK